MTPYLVGVAGPSGAGKTELSRRLAGVLSAPVIALDSYYRDLPHLTPSQRAGVNFDEPHALDHDLLFDQLRRLAAGEDIAVPVYDFATHRRAGRVEVVRAAGFAIIEGLFALFWEDIRRLLSTKVYVSLDDHTCFERRLERDVRERGRTPASVHEQYERTVRPMAERYVLPARALADVVVGGADPLEQSAAAVLAHIDQVRALAYQQL